MKKNKDFTKHPVIEGFKKVNITFSALTLILLFALFILSFFEIVYNGTIHEFPDNIAGVIGWACLADITFVLSYLLPVYLAYMLLFMFSEALAKGVYKALITIVVV